MEQRRRRKMTFARGYIPNWIKSILINYRLAPTEREILYWFSTFDQSKGFYGTVEWFTQYIGWDVNKRSQVSRALKKLQDLGILEKCVAGGRNVLKLSNRMTKFNQQSEEYRTHTSETVQQGPLFEPSDVFKEHYNTNTKTRNKAAKCTSKGASVTNYHGECDESSRSSVTICHTYIQSKIQSKNTKYITYGQDNFLCIYDEQGKLIDAHYAGKAQDVAQACEAYACIKNKTSYQSQNLDLEKIPLENKCGELKGCDLACTAPRLLTSVVSSGTEQADSKKGKRL